MAKLGMKLRSGVQSLHVSSFICLLLTVSPLIAKRRITKCMHSWAVWMCGICFTATPPSASSHEAYLGSSAPSIFLFKGQQMSDLCANSRRLSQGPE